jgi:outer membrane receptor protein involved in Fe transport
MKAIYRRNGWKVAMAAALALCQARAHGQTNAAVAGATNALPDATGTNVTELGSAMVVGHFDDDRNAVAPDLGATAFKVDQVQILSEAKGGNGGVNDVVLRAPGVAQDSAVNGDLHVRGEHGNLQYRINDVLLPEGIGGFGLELDTRFIDSLQLITGALPAQYGFRTSGVIDIQTKSGSVQQGGEIGIYGGSFDTYRPYVEFGGTKGKWTIFGDASYEHNALGIENPTNTPTALHDNTDQYRTFIYGSYAIDDTSRFTFMGSADYSTFQIPNTGGLGPGVNANGVPYYPLIPGATSNSFASSQLDENQIEQNYFGVFTYQKSAGDFNYQASLMGRASRVHFEPDPVGDLFFNGESSDVARALYSGGAQFDASYALGDKHTLRGGFMFLDEYVTENTTTGVFPVDGAGNPNGPVKYLFDGGVQHGIFAGVYIQDEWKIFPKVTLNYGARFDEFYSTSDKENQPSPRVNLVYKPTDDTTFHIGYARYFTPPPLESIPNLDLAQFNGTTGSTGNTENSSVRSERANYFDAGVSQKVLPGLQIGVDGYYKSARNELDDGLFGQSQILDAFNYEQALIYGVEFSSSYTRGGLSLYANVAYSVAVGKNWNSSQFLFGPDGPGTQLDYVRNNWIYMDHDQRISGSFGVSYLWKQTHGSTRFYCDALYGSGLRADSMNSDGSVIPNGASLPAYSTVNMGAEQTIQWSNKDHLKVRLDVINITDNVYELRNGSGVGVNAPQFGQRIGFFGTLSYLF